MIYVSILLLAYAWWARSRLSKSQPTVKQPVMLYDESENVHWIWDNEKWVKV